MSSVNQHKLAKFHEVVYLVCMSEQKRRVNLTVHPSLYEKAQNLMAEDCFADFSGYVEHLIRVEWQRRNANLTAEQVGKVLGPYAQHTPQASALAKTPAEVIEPTASAKPKRRAA